MVDSIYHMALKFIESRIFGVKTSRFCHILGNLIMNVITYLYEICLPLVVYRFYCMALYHSHMRPHVINPVNIFD